VICSNVDQRRVRRQRFVARDHKLEKFILDVALPERRNSCMCGESVCGTDTGIECFRPVHRAEPASNLPGTAPDKFQAELGNLASLGTTMTQKIGGAIGDVRANIDIPSLNKYLTDCVKRVKAPVQVKQFKVMTPG